MTQGLTELNKTAAAEKKLTIVRRRRVMIKQNGLYYLSKRIG